MVVSAEGKGTASTGSSIRQEEDRKGTTVVGYYIGCGNKAVHVEMRGVELRANIGRIMDDVWSIISFGVGQRNNEKVDHALFDDVAWKLKAISSLKEMARNQLGTVGSGNHYVDLFTDEEDRVWIGVHFGSRGLGHKTATHVKGGVKPGQWGGVKVGQ